MNPDTSALRVLLADEIDLVRDGLRSLLSSRPGWEICAEAINGREAVEKAIQFRPNIAVLDLSLPELNGLEATRRIRQALPGTGIMLLVLQNSEQLTQEASDAGAHGLILKSDAKRLLVAAIESVAPQSRFLSAATPELGRQSRLESESGWANARRPRRRLTPREREIVQLVVGGRTNKEIAALLVRSVKTVEAHRANIMNKLGLQRFSELVHYAIRNRIVDE
jgi:DNA-binding NarL/FixJ family response regulator